LTASGLEGNLLFKVVISYTVATAKQYSYYLATVWGWAMDDFSPVRLFKFIGTNMLMEQQPFRVSSLHSSYRFIHVHKI